MPARFFRRRTHVRGDDTHGGDPRRAQSPLEVVTDVYVPGASGQPRPARFRALLLAAVVALVLLVVGTLVTLRLEVWNTEESKRAEDKAEKAIDAEEEPFVSYVSPFREVPQVKAIRYVMDRTLTRAEQTKLNEFGIYSEEADAYLMKRGARPILLSPNSNQFPHHDNLPGGEASATRFGLHLHSKRKEPVTISDMRANSVKCSPSRAKTVVERRPEGESAYGQILFDLSKPDAAPLVSSYTPNHGLPYFNGKAINLGNGEKGANLQVTGSTDGDTCTWEIDAKYSIGDHEQHKTLRDGRKPFRSEGLPRRPRQHLIAEQGAGGGRWVDCRDEKQAEKSLVC